MFCRQIGSKTRKSPLRLFQKNSYVTQYKKKKDNVQLSQPKPHYLSSSAALEILVVLNRSYF